MKKIIKRFILITSISAVLGLGVYEPVFSAEHTGSNIISNNIHDHDYSGTAKVSNSYLVPNSNGTFTRVENYGDVILVETYNSAFKCINQATIPFELSAAISINIKLNNTKYFLFIKNASFHRRCD